MTLSRLRTLIGIIGLFLVMSQPVMGSSSYSNAFTDDLSEVQVQWIEDNKDDTISIGLNNHSAMVYFDGDENPSGYLYDVFNEISVQTGLRFELIIGDWNEIVQEVYTGELDLMAGNVGDEETVINYSMTRPIRTKPYWMCSNGDYQSIYDLRYLEIGFKSGTNAYEYFNETYSLDISPVFFEDKISMFESLSAGDVDAVMTVDCLQLNQFLNEYEIERNFMVRDIIHEIRVAGNEEVLVSIIDLFIEDNLVFLNKSVVKAYNGFVREKIQISQEERDYLEGLDLLNVGYITNFLPFDYSAGGEMKGISAGLVKDISNILALPVTFTPYESVLEMEAALLDGSIDMVTSYGVYGELGDSRFLVSDPYSSSKIAVLGHKTNRVLPHKLHDLNDSRIALIRGSWQETMLLTNRINYTPIYVESIHQMMEAVNSNDADYAVENQWTFSYIMNEVNYDKLRPSGEIDISDSRHFLFSKEQVILKNLSNRIIRIVNLKEYETNGLYENYQIQAAYEFYEILTVTLFLLLCFIGIYIAFLINRLNVERQKAESANKSKSEFLAKMSHEIRTPLTAIMGYINLLSRSENISGKEKEQLKIAYNSSNILIHLVNDILDFSKIEAGKVSIVEQDFNLRLMINNAINIIGVMAEEKKIEFVVKLHQDLPPYIVGDERRLEQILINILSNSVKFTDAGKVELIIAPEYFDDKVRLNFKVKDTGKGMKAETINMIFDAFEQEDNSISRRYGGTGLGLYITKDFIERMGGSIKVNSNVGKGTDFSFFTIHELAKEVQEINETSLSLTIHELKGMKVLLVEDNDINQMIIRDILVDMGLRVIITNNGAEALEVVNPGFDFVLMDIQMPVMNGLMAVRVMKYREELKNVPIIALTANVMPEQIESYHNEGFDGYCSKPIMVNELAQTLLQMYEKYHLDKEVTE